MADYFKKAIPKPLKPFKMRKIYFLCLAIFVSISPLFSQGTIKQANPVDEFAIFKEKGFPTKNNNQASSNRVVVPPPYDNICNAQSLIIDGAPITVNNTDATVEAGEPTGTCYSDGQAVSNTVWFYFDILVPGDYRVSTDITVLSNDDTQMALFTSSNGTCTGTLTQVACDDDGGVLGSGYLSIIDVTANVGGIRLYVQVDGWLGTTGDFQIQVTKTSLPFNDDICSAEPLTVNGSPVFGDNTGATVSGDPLPGCWFDNTLNNTIWYSFVAPFNGNYTVSTDISVNSNDDTQLGLYTSSNGTCTGVLTEVACDDDGGVLGPGYLSVATANSITAGQTVFVQVDGWNGTVGLFEIEVTGVSSIPFDASLANALVTPKGLAGYAKIPSNQASSSSFDITVENLGSNTINNVNVTGTIPGVGTVSASTPSLASNTANRLNTTAFVAPALSSNTVNFNVSITQSDGDPANNTTSLSFDMGSYSDRLFAREDVDTVTNTVGFTGGTGRLGNIYEFTANDTIEEITLYFGGGAAGQNYEIIVSEYNPATNSSPLTDVYNSGPITLTGSEFQTFSVFAPVNAGSYFVGVKQTGTVNIGLGFTTDVFRWGTSLFGPLDGSSYTDVGTIPTLQGTFLVRLTMNQQVNALGGSSVPGLTVFPPSGQSGAYEVNFPEAVANGWGIPDMTLRDNSVYGALELVNDGTVADSLGCNALINGSAIAGKIAVVYRGGCEFGLKAFNAQNAGAIGVVVVNNAPGPPIVMGGGIDGPNVTIPVGMISLDDGATINSTVATGNNPALLGVKPVNEFDVALSKEALLKPKFSIYPNYITDDVANYSITFGGDISNEGIQDMTNVRLRAELFQGNTSIFVANSPFVSVLPSGQSSYRSIAQTFSQNNLPDGRYEVRYSIDGGTNDQYTFDNEYSVFFDVTDSVIGYGNTNPDGSSQASEYWRLTADEFEQCIYFRNDELDSVWLDGLSFSISATNNIINETVFLNIYEWNGVSETLVGQSPFTFTNNNQEETEVYGSVTNLSGNRLALDNAQDYFLCVKTGFPASPNPLFVGQSERSYEYNQAYGINNATYRFPIRDFTQPFTNFQGLVGLDNLAPAIKAHVKDASCTISSSSINVTACDSYTWSDNGNTYSSSGTYTAVLTNAGGCDSVITLNLTINTSSTGSESITACDSYTWPSTGLTYSTSGAYTDTLLNANGCDSIVTLNLTINNSNTGTESITTCDSYTWAANGQTYTASGAYTATLTNAAGCDSVVTLNLFLNNSTGSTLLVSICQGGSFNFGGQTLTTAGSYSDTLIAANGCDSIVDLTLFVDPTYNETASADICAGDSYVFGAQTLTSSGTYVETFSSQAGCDSTVTLTLTVNTVDNTVSVNNATLTANASNATYQWIDCDNANAPISGETNQSFTATQNGNYAVIVTEGNCSDTSACIPVTVIGLQNAISSSLRIYPNPARDMLFIENPAETGTQQIRIISATGAEMINVEVHGNNNDVNISSLSPGMYHIIISGENYSEQLRFVKE